MSFLTATGHLASGRIMCRLGSHGLTWRMCRTARRTPCSIHCWVAVSSNDEVLDLSGLILTRHHSVFRCLGLLSLRVPIENWCVVGGLMVLIVGHQVGRSNRRSSQTKD